MTWPLGRVTDVVIPASDDAHFSIWRLAWVAHQLPADPQHLFDANIFHPAKGTLALSDAMLLVGALGLPFFHAGVNPAIVHNYLMLAAIVSSMLCMFALARRLTGSDPAAWLAAIIFGLAPYRMAHIGHLELQWTMWMPLAMLLLHRLVEKPTLARGLALGLALAAQAFCSIYYGLFLACYLAAAWLVMVPFEKAKGRIAVGNGDRHRAAVACCRDLRSSLFGDTRAVWRAPRRRSRDIQRGRRGLPARAPGKRPARPAEFRPSHRTSGACFPGSWRYSWRSAPSFRHSHELRLPT